MEDPSSSKKNFLPQLPDTIRTEIADRLVRVLVPVVSVIVAIIFIGSVLILDRPQYYRLISPSLFLLTITLPFLIAIKNKPKAGAMVLFALINLTVFIQMFFSGGIDAQIFFTTLVIVTVFVVMHGIKGGFIYTIFVVSAGGFYIWLMSAGIIRKVPPPPPSFKLFILSSQLACQVLVVSIPVKIMTKALLDVKKANEEKSNVAAELDDILERTPDIIYKTDANHTIVYVNKAILRYGFEPSQMVGMNIRDIVYPDDMDYLEERLKNITLVQNLDQEFRIRLLLRNKNDAAKKPFSTFLTRTSIIFDNTQKKYIGAQGIARDISLEEEYGVQLRQFAAIIDQADEEILIADPDVTIHYVNASFLRNSGYSPNEILGKKLFMLKSGSPNDSLNKKIDSTIKAKRNWKGEIYTKRKNGETALHEVTVMPILDSEGNVSNIVAIQRDITEKTSSELQLQQLQKMEAIGTLAGGIAHDFNNMLGAILGFADLVKDGLPEGSKIRHRQEQVIKASIRAQKLVEQILLFSRQTEKNVKPMEPHLVLSEALKLMRSTIPSTIEIRQTIPKNLGSIISDTTHFHQIIMNLCTNAYHAMKETGGVLSVTLSKVDLQKTDISFSKLDLNPGTYLMLEFSDTGHGMDQETLKKIFDPYFTTKPIGEGTGLGLSVVHGIVNNYGGVIKVFSEPGCGTHVRIYFPRVEQVTHTEEIQLTGLLTGNERILVVDDDLSMLEMLETSLHTLGYRTSSFSSSLEALDAFQDEPDHFDAIITDMTMPRMTGLELAEKIFAIDPQKPVIICTGFSEMITEEKAQALGIKGILYKPVLRKSLSDLIRNALDDQNEKV